MRWGQVGLNALEERRCDEHPATARAGSDGWSRPRTLRVALLLTLIVVVAVGGPLASGIATGAIGIPHNDDWAFSRIAFDLAEHGELNLVGWNQMTLVGHLVWAMPFLAVFGTSLETLHVAQAVAAAAGLVLAFFVLRRAVPVGLALLGTVLLAIFPGYALLATTYMTDTTAFAAQMGCLLLGLIAIERGHRAHLLLGLSLAVGLYAYTIREVSLAAPVAVLAGWYVTSADARARRRTSVLFAVVLALAAGFFVWRHSLPGDEEPWLIGDAPMYERVADVVRAYFTTAFALLPALILMLVRVPRRPVSRWQAGAAVTAFVVGAVRARSRCWRPADALRRKRAHEGRRRRRCAPGPPGSLPTDDLGCDEPCGPVRGRPARCVSCAARSRKRFAVDAPAGTSPTRGRPCSVR